MFELSQIRQTPACSVVMGRDCRMCSPAPSKAHSMSCGAPICAAIRRAASTSPVISAGVSGQVSPAGVSSVTQPVVASTTWVQPSTSPAISPSPSPATEEITIRSGREVTGSAEKITPAACGAIIVCTMTEGGACPALPRWAR